MLQREALDIAYLKEKDSGLEWFASFENKRNNTNITSEYKEIVSVQASKMSKALRSSVSSHSEVICMFILLKSNFKKIKKYFELKIFARINFRAHMFSAQILY